MHPFPAFSLKKDFHCRGDILLRRGHMETSIFSPKEPTYKTCSLYLENLVEAGFMNFESV